MGPRFNASGLRSSWPFDLEERADSNAGAGKSPPGLRSCISGSWACSLVGEPAVEGRQDLVGR